PVMAALVAAGLAAGLAVAAIIAGVVARLAGLDPRGFACGGGTRNVTLLWAATDAALPGPVLLGFQVALFWAFLMPALVALRRQG
ncbi:hypothetical protein, partial [Roseomonas rosulenta]|uniref:hypothetical protein n=1 Tax=Roseomonas rosulenta TaxID=2748667 RepID=UPI0018DF2062